MVLSNRFLSALRTRVQSGERQYRIARRAGIHPTTLSHIVNDALPLRFGDARVVRIGSELGLSPDECFAAEQVTA